MNRNLMIFNKDKFCAWEERVAGSNWLAEMDLGVLGDSRLSRYDPAASWQQKNVFWTVRA